MPGCKNRINHTSIEEIDENPYCPHNCDITIFKAQGGPRGNPKKHYWEETP
jgi:hypothetical protein